MSVTEVVKLVAVFACMHWYNVVCITGYVVGLIKNNRPNPKGQRLF